MKSLIKKFLLFRVKSKTKFNRSYSQCGEDLIIRYLFLLKGIKRPTFLDIGSHDPFFLSNTALFYELGSYGINVEPNPLLYNNFVRERKRDFNINLGISAKEQMIDFYFMDDSTLSTFSKIEMEKLKSYGEKVSSIAPVSTITINNLLKNMCKGLFPDFLTIDTEGLDYEIISTIDFDFYSPKVICIETREYSPTGRGEKRDDILDFLHLKGYIEYANTNLNSIMVHEKFWFGDQ